MDPTAAGGIQVLPAHYQAPDLYAGFWRRVAAWIIDTLIIGATHWLLVLSFGTWLLVPWAMLGGAHGAATARFLDLGLQPLGILIFWLYFAVFESSTLQATPGKLALGLIVTDDYGRRIGFARATGRYFGKFVSVLILGVGFLLAGWTARKQALHDFMAGCCVVRKAGLAAWRSGLSTDAAAATAGTQSHAVRPSHTGMPGWAIALIVIAGCFFLIPVAAILTAIAIPAYQNHAVRAEVSEGMQMTERARTLVAEYIGQRGALPDSNADLGLPRPEAIRARYVTSVRVVAEGKLVVTYGNQANPLIRGGHVVISPQGNAAMLRWRCSSPDIDVRYLPRQCHD
ncbi:MAG: RDD family protein [Rhodanobacteraceae bacterium]